MRYDKVHVLLGHIINDPAVPVARIKIEFYDEKPAEAAERIRAMLYDRFGSGPVQWSVGFDNHQRVSVEIEA